MCCWNSLKPMNLKAPEELYTLREMFRHEYCHYSKVSPLHSSLDCTAEDVQRLPLAASCRMRTNSKSSCSDFQLCEGGAG